MEGPPPRFIPLATSVRPRALWAGPGDKAADDVATPRTLHPKEPASKRDCNKGMDDVATELDAVRTDRKCVDRCGGGGRLAKGTNRGRSREAKLRSWSSG